MSMTTSRTSVHKSRRLACVAAVLLSVTLSASLQAGDLDLQFFGTLGVSCFTSNAADYTQGEQSQPSGPGRSRRCDAGLDSLLGAQLNLRAGNRWTAALQLTSFRDPKGDFAPGLTLAQLRWQVSDRTLIGIGRTYNPNFLHSEYRNVRYTLTTARPPTEVYSLLESFSFDGLHAHHNTAFGEWSVELQGAFGRMQIANGRSNAQGTDRITANRGVFVGLSASRRDWTGKFTVTTGKATYLPTWPRYLEIYEPLRRLYPEAAETLEIDHKRMWLLSFATSYDRGDWLLEAEYAFRSVNAGTRNQHGAYLIAARRLGSWTPYAGIAHRWSSAASTASVPVPALQAAIDRSLAASVNDRTSLMLGLSRELGTTAILKLQVDYVDPRKHSFGMLNRHRDWLPAGRGEWLFSLNIDFLF